MNYDCFRTFFCVISGSCCREGWGSLRVGVVEFGDLLCVLCLLKMIKLLGLDYKVNTDKD